MAFINNMINQEDYISILYPNIDNVQYNELGTVTCHDLGIDLISKNIAENEKEQKLIMNVLSTVTKSPEVSNFRTEVFVDMLSLPDMRNKMKDLLDQIQMLKDFGIMKREIDKKSGLWDLLHRLEEINDYIKCVDAMNVCLSDERIKSKGLINLREYVKDIIKEPTFDAMKKDIADLKANTSNLRSITVGINVNARFEAESIGLISVNSLPFKSSGVVGNFAEALSSKAEIKDNLTWDGDMHYKEANPNTQGASKTMEKLAGFMAMRQTPLLDARTRQTIVDIPDQDGGGEIPFYLDQITTKMVGQIVKRLREILSKYVTVAVSGITSLIPEFIYYIRTAEYIETLKGKGYTFSGATAISRDENKLMDARGIYNLKLASAGVCSAKDIVKNDLIFDKDNLVYILTGANRGGKTTITQAVGIAYVMAQGGLFVPADDFKYLPIDGIYTHFPADEDKTMDLGRLGEECSRFKEMYESATEDSLMLMNETFSTTSFEEGYYIAKDSVKAILSKGIRTIYNTHMHKLAYDLEEINIKDFDYKAASLVVKSDGGNRSFKVVVAPPEGLSYAQDIAAKYGVTYEMLTKSK
ncbi:MAG: DNA mismatch repair protein [Clostridia bacterium]|nr:DNA mismatch repair protein [Clostridia bacterium]